MRQTITKKRALYDCNSHVAKAPVACPKRVSLMRRSLLAYLFPALIAVMMTAGFALAAHAPTKSSSAGDVLAAQVTTAVSGAGERMITPAILVHARLQFAQPEPAQTCRHALKETNTDDALGARCRAWLAAGDDDPDGGGRLARAGVCRRVVAADAGDADLVRRCRELLADLDPTPGASAMRPTSRAPASG